MTKFNNNQSDNLFSQVFGVAKAQFYWFKHLAAKSNW